jgi:hypothetical protein
VAAFGNDSVDGMGWPAVLIAGFAVLRMATGVWSSTSRRCRMWTSGAAVRRGHRRDRSARPGAAVALVLAYLAGWIAVMVALTSEKQSRPGVSRGVRRILLDRICSAHLYAARRLTHRRPRSTPADASPSTQQAGWRIAVHAAGRLARSPASAALECAEQMQWDTNLSASRRHADASVTPTAPSGRR